jgi:hypothetical protein
MPQSWNMLKANVFRPSFKSEFFLYLSMFVFSGFVDDIRETWTILSFQKIPNKFIQTPTTPHQQKKLIEKRNRKKKSMV